MHKHLIWKLTVIAEPRELPAPRIKLAKSEAITAINTVEEVKAKTGKDKVIVIQPFGRGAQVQQEYIIDTLLEVFIRVIS